MCHSIKSYSASSQLCQSGYTGRMQSAMPRLTFDLSAVIRTLVGHQTSFAARDAHLKYCTRLHPIQGQATRVGWVNEHSDWVQGP